MADEHKRRKSKLVSGSGKRGKHDAVLNALEKKIEDLRVAYEQYFVDVLPQPPTLMQKEVVIAIRELLKAPFKSSTARFRLRNLITRYQIYRTYWERVQKQREEGTYVKDVFKAEMREREALAAAEEASAQGRNERGMKQLFSVYEAAVKKVGAGDRLDYEAFKKSLLNRARTLKEKHGVTKLSYRIVVKDGKVVVKASPKNESKSS